MRGAIALTALVVAGVTLPALRARASARNGEPLPGLSLQDLPPSLARFFGGDMSEWKPPSHAVMFLHAVEQAEQKYRLPHNLLARLVDQESDWMPNAFNKRSGATGIAQIVPRWHPNVNPWEPFGSIDYAGFYLRQLFDNFGTWERALAAYNWGWGRVEDWINAGEVFAQLPRETQNYVTEITGDVPV